MRGASSVHYYAAKYATTFLSGAIVAIAPLLLDFYLTSLILPQATPDPSSGMCPIFAYSMWSNIFLFAVSLRSNVPGAHIRHLGHHRVYPHDVFQSPRQQGIGNLLRFFLCSIAAYLFGTGNATYLAPTVFLRPDQPSWGYEFWQIALVLSVSACFEALYLVHLYRHGIPYRYSAHAANPFRTCRPLLDDAR